MDRPTNTYLHNKRRIVYTIVFVEYGQITKAAFSIQGTCVFEAATVSLLVTSNSVSLLVAS